MGYSCIYANVQTLQGQHLAEYGNARSICGEILLERCKTKESNKEKKLDISIIKEEDEPRANMIV